MTRQADDPLTRALEALQYLRAPRTDPVSLAFWDQVHDALLEARAHQAALLDVVRTAQAVLAHRDDFGDAIEAEDMDALGDLAGAATTAEDALSDALDRLPDTLLREVAHRAVLPTTRNENGPKQ